MSPTLEARPAARGARLAPSAVPLPPRRPLASTQDAPVTIRPRLLQTFIALGGLATVGIWFADTPSTIRSTGATLLAAGRITGLVGSYTIIVLLTLMARVPAIERGVGADRLARMHSSAGRYAVCLLSLHALLILWGSALVAHASLTGQAGTLLSSYPDVLIATIGWVLLVLVGIASARAARRRLSYETWYAIHLTTYLAIALAFAHQFAAGADFVDNVANRVFWAGLYLLVSALLIAYRVVVPVRTALRHRLQVTEVRPEAPGVVSLYLTGPYLGRLGIEAGQFLRLRFLTRDGWYQSHPFSLSAAPTGDVLRVTVKDLGDYSRVLQRVRVGTTVLAEGPYGALTVARRTRQKVLLIAGGIGVTPLRALLAALPAAPGDLTLLYRASRREDIVFRDELAVLAERRGVRVHYLIGPRGSVADPFTPERMQRLVPDVAEHDVYLCGPDPMTETAIRALRGAGVPRRRLHAESFAF